MAFDWVAARSKCSVREAFHLISEALDSDVKSANGLKRQGVTFHLNYDAADKVVISRDRNTGISNDVTAVVFELAAGGIVVRRRSSNGPGDVMFTATPRLNNDGECLFEVDGQELKIWQISRKALDDLFFGF